MDDLGLPVYPFSLGNLPCSDVHPFHELKKAFNISVSFVVCGLEFNHLGKIKNMGKLPQNCG